MAFTDGDREQIVAEARSRYTAYWHAVHPVTFEPPKLYRSAWTDPQWDAVSLLMDERDGVVATNFFYEYQADFSKYTNRPYWMPPSPRLRFGHPERMPFARVKEKHVGNEMAMEMRRWILKAFYLSGQYHLLAKKLNLILKRTHKYDRNHDPMGQTAIVNTPRILHGVWPEVTPFMDEEDRAEARNSRTKRYPLPKCWVTGDLETFQGEEGMEALNTTLLVVSMVEDYRDGNYPQLMT